MGEVVLPATSAASGRPLHGPRSFHGIHTIHHSQFTRQDKLDTSLPQHVKQLIIEGSPVRLNTYEPEKVFIRTDQRYAIRDSKQIAIDRSRRRQDVYRGGFCSDAKEPYRALGEPIIDSDALIYTCLKLDPGSFQRNTSSKVTELASKSNEASTSTRKYRLGNSTKDGNGFSAIKNKLAKSKQRLHAVKFGVPFVQMCEDLDKENGLNRPQAGPDGDNALDWGNLKLDHDKQSYFINLLENKRDQSAEAVKSRQAPGIPSAKGTRRNTSESQASDRISVQSRDTNDPKGELPSLTSSLSSKSPTAIKHMEAALQVQKHDSQAEIMENFFAVRDQFYEQRQRLTQILNEDLDRLDFDRKAEFMRKFRAFHVGKDAAFVDDIAIMRHKAAIQRRAEKIRILRQHPCQVAESPYTSLAEKSIIEDGRPFSQSVFVQLMKLIPQSEFMNDEIQRIIRFVRVNENINEREYVEAVEMANHMIV
ncbi:hypothetical protein HDU67_003971 [Dinochytrium kinnereticum]|nr:hypothetical protein HDU67_003971 [Dinochytrium kinnereticum]